MKEHADELKKVERVLDEMFLETVAMLDEIHAQPVSVEARTAMATNLSASLASYAVAGLAEIAFNGNVGAAAQYVCAQIGGMVFRSLLEEPEEEATDNVH